MELDIASLRGELGRLYNRPQNSVVGPYDEEALLCEVCRRQDWRGELHEIKVYRERLEEKRFFPQSLRRLLECWQDVIDKSRSYQTPKADMSIIEKDIERITKYARTL